ncbi:hypothetical protein QUB80_05500 [Chlorogloeopsis sp. ULAP01]|uniref:DUF7219 family protein n=1 Tax=Chlorogloeopsis sp. ULAP01 TaxID=3056483 RepID=UPI0025AA6D81|nr:hypothetical protein [Chlorogloeopsis sp. ULAP01]MDM9380154.1 hypothetical protein [Chlorogloeopsis sp. ULAP01]
MTNKDEFLYTYRPYHGEVKPENLAFNANLQEFAQRISYICSLETNGKIDSDQAYQQIKDIWKGLKRSKEQLGISKDQERPPEE